ALSKVAISGSRFMIKALRNGPMRTVETYSVKVATAVHTLTMATANHPYAVCGVCQCIVAAAPSANNAVDDKREYQVVRRGSVFCSSVRATRRNAVRHSAAPTAKLIPRIDNCCG